MIKCIAIDMDGTLLTSAQEITEANRDAIKKAQEKGVEVIISTGRAYEEAGDLLKDAGIITPMICANGAEIRTNKHEIVGTNPLEKSLAKEMAEILHQNQVYYEVYTDKGTYTLDKKMARSLIMDIFTVSGHIGNLEDIQKAAEERLEVIHEVESYLPLFEEDAYIIYKLLVFHTEPTKLAEVRKKLSGVKGLAISASGQENLELTAVNAQKGVALEKFVQSKGISLKDTMAIGDNFNDLSMFLKAGRAVAMGNAVDEIKKQCHFVTGTNEESGVAQAINLALSEES
ncbi:Cof-type HAD-IIB family hydrolase [Niallia sp. 03133]|uniref:Cof-type HAD-IIB family hydrolase n=1 Tax=Niallia sp. 03133 TaxID=3458060 RepID=UPI0040449F76